MFTKSIQDGTPAPPPPPPLPGPHPPTSAPKDMSSAKRMLQDIQAKMTCLLERHYEGVLQATLVLNLPPDWSLECPHLCKQQTNNICAAQGLQSERLDKGNNAESMHTMKATKMSGVRSQVTRTTGSTSKVNLLWPIV